jgi:hypothetical protein
MFVPLQESLQLREALAGADGAKPPVELDATPVDDARTLEDDALAAATLAPVARKPNPPGLPAPVQKTL